MGTQSTLVDQVSQAMYWDQAIRPPEIAFPEYPVPSPLEEYLFDLQGFLLLRGALSVEEVAACNAIVDAYQRRWSAASGGAMSSERTIPSIGAAATSRSMSLERLLKN